MPNIGPLEIAVVLIIVLIIFGPKRLPELGQSLGRGIREVRGSLSGDKDKDDSPEEKPAELQASQAESTEASDKPAEPVEGEVVTENKG